MFFIFVVWVLSVLVLLFVGLVCFVVLSVVLPVSFQVVLLLFVVQLVFWVLVFEVIWEVWVVCEVLVLELLDGLEFDFWFRLVWFVCLWVVVAVVVELVFVLCVDCVCAFDTVVKIVFCVDVVLRVDGFKIVVVLFVVFVADGVVVLENQRFLVGLDGCAVVWIVKLVVFVVGGRLSMVLL